MRKIFLGAPNAGKGTAASRIAPIRKIPHISTGYLFRENIKNETEIGLKAKKYMESGELVPDEVVIEMLKNRISKSDCENGFILDGFPRTIPQAEQLKKLIDIDMVVNLDVDDNVIIKRASSRISCKNCGEIFNLINNPTKKEGTCDKCEGMVARRPDDEPEIAQKRIETYREQTAPL
ncbi:MAG TPA: nucleoside monophosphate kinase, partial [Candidatus Pacearchaeota archaeon]|nr:nucleoside monophosphate kinase [Candidatus Pacearchaeota archaeon]